MKPIETSRLILRNWEERDRTVFRRINSDDRVMEFFDFRRDAPAADSFMDQLTGEIARDGFGWTAAEIAAAGECIGFIGLHPVEIPGIASDGTFEIGWRLVPEHWGKGYASEGANALLAFGFTELGLAEIISFAVWSNTRSTSVMERIGMQRDPSGDFDHPKVIDPALKRHVLYRIRREEWQRRHSL
ncbi:GNAT family N-acetyltransferase [Mesorhizobium sp. VNQ89]|uniref:GNAT family N-acetyltransferase n=1 Tax=Mesorhizobium quangtriensis TaxID=3157709 RepID=UPI0032B7F035